MASPHSLEPKNGQSHSIITLALIGLVRFYRYFISPMFAPSCRFNPTCSRYALQALQTHGAIYGSWLTIKRIARCHPLNAGGDDPVPPPN